MCQTPRCVLVALIWVARCRVLWLVFSFHGPRLLVLMRPYVITVVHMALLAYGWERGDPRRIARMGELRARIEHLEGLLVAGALPGAEAGPIPPPSPPPAAAPRG
jgi:hypothetical protein